MEASRVFRQAISIDQASNLQKVKNEKLQSNNETLMSEHVQTKINEMPIIINNPRMTRPHVKWIIICNYYKTPAKSSYYKVLKKELKKLGYQVRILCNGVSPDHFEYEEYLCVKDPDITSCMIL